MKYKTLMLIDDDEDACFIVKAFQELMKIADGYMQFTSAVNAIQHLKNNPDSRPDLILVDVNMPVMDGFVFLEELHKIIDREKIKPKIFMLTASINPEDFKRAGKLHVDGYLVKPLTKSKLDFLMEQTA